MADKAVTPSIEGHYIETSDGLMLAAYETGKADGPSIVFLSGFGFSHTAFILQNKSFLAEKYRLISVDLRGHGDSSKPNQLEFYATSQAWAHDLHAVLTHYKCEDAVIVGWSFGAMVFMDWVHIHGVQAIRGFVSVGSNAGLIELDDARRARRRAALEMVGKKQPNFDTELADARNFVCRITKERLPDELFDMMVISNLKQPLYAAQLVAQKTLEHSDLRSALTCPTVFILGEHDAANSADGLGELAASLSNARTEIMQGVGHAPFLEDPERFNRALDEFMINLGS